MNQRRDEGLWAVAFSLLGFRGAMSTRADIVVSTGVNDAGTYSVLLDTVKYADTVTGRVGLHNLLVEFVSTSGSGRLLADSSGQAISGGTGNAPFTHFIFRLEKNRTFTRGVFNIVAGTKGAVVISVGGLKVDGGFFVDNFAVDANGQNFFTVDAINGQFIKDISLTAINGATFKDVRQLRLGGGDLV